MIRQAVKIGGGVKWHLAEPASVAAAREHGIRLMCACGRRGRLREEGPTVRPSDKLDSTYCQACRELHQ